MSTYHIVSNHYYVSNVPVFPRFTTARDDVVSRLSPDSSSNKSANSSAAANNEVLSPEIAEEPLLLRQNVRRLTNENDRAFYDVTVTACIGNLSSKIKLVHIT